MKTTITLEFQDGDAQAVEELTRGVDLGTLLRDAFGEFQDTRQPATEYVKKRYGIDGSFRDRKVLEVGRRCKLAELLRRGDPTITVEK
jgi:hypothetical protein